MDDRFEIGELVRASQVCTELGVRCMQENKRTIGELEAYGRDEGGDFYTVKSIKYRMCSSVKDEKPYKHERN